MSTKLAHKKKVYQRRMPLVKSGLKDQIIVRFLNEAREFKEKTGKDYQAYYRSVGLQRYYKLLSPKTQKALQMALESIFKPKPTWLPIEDEIIKCKSSSNYE